MKILHNVTDNRPYYTDLITDIQRAAKIATSEYDFLVPKGWQLIVKMKSDEVEEPFFHLHLAEGTGGSYAEAKMATLENFPEQPYTGGDGRGDILNMLERLGKNDTATVNEISAIESPNQLTKIQKEWLRDTCGIASMYGGIRVLYEFLINTDEPEPHTNEGEILIAFSGASQEQDVFFAAWMLSAIQESLAKSQRNIQHSYLLEDLRKSPVIHHWFKLMHIAKYDR